MQENFLQYSFCIALQLGQFGISFIFACDTWFFYTRKYRAFSSKYDQLKSQEKKLYSIDWKRLFHFLFIDRFKFYILFFLSYIAICSSLFGFLIMTFCFWIFGHQVFPLPRGRINNSQPLLRNLNLTLYMCCMCAWELMC